MCNFLEYKGTNPWMDVMGVLLDLWLTGLSRHEDRLPALRLPVLHRRMFIHG